MRKGQKLVNHFIKKGWKNENIHQAIFYIEDEEFEEIIK